MRYFKLVQDFENDDDYVIVKSSNKAEHYDSEIVKGELIENWDKDIKFEYNVEDGKILSDYLVSDNGWVIVSKKFRDVVKEIVGENIQYLDINIINSKTKEEDNTYKVANVTKHLEALDLENSVYDFFELDDEKILSVEKYALKQDVIKNCNIFKLKDETIPVFVSEKVKDIVEENSLIGFQFLEVKVVQFNA